MRAIYEKQGAVLDGTKLRGQVSYTVQRTEDSGALQVALNGFMPFMGYFHDIAMDRYDRMLRAQKAIKDRDEESEERKARKASEIIQQQPDKPIGEIGSDTRDLSKDFTGDLKEEFPPSYKPLLNDYYKSLNIYGGEK